MDRSELAKIGYRLRSSARGDLLDYLEGTLPLLAGKPAETVQKPQAMTGCPTCEARRVAHARAKAAYRAKRRQSSLSK